MKGINTKILRDILQRVPKEFQERPVLTIDRLSERLEQAVAGTMYAVSKKQISESYTWLPLSNLKDFSFDELCKMKFSSILMMDQSVEQLFETKLSHEIVRKIKSSLWRLGYNHGTWNEIVDAYENILHSSFVSDPDFELRLDYTTSYNEIGYSKFNRTYLDGVFGFLVYYKKKHVMTIGFSLIGGRGILIQQIQAVGASGNRWLYKLPGNRTEFVISFFRRNFPGYNLYIVDGNTLVDKTLANYRHTLESQEGFFERNKNDSCYSGKYLTEQTKLLSSLRKSIAHLEQDRGRIASLYGSVGNFSLKKQVKEIQALVFHQVILC